MEKSDFGGKLFMLVFLLFCETGSHYVVPASLEFKRSVCLSLNLVMC